MLSRKYPTDRSVPQSCDTRPPTTTPGVSRSSVPVSLMRMFVPMDEWRGEGGGWSPANEWSAWRGRERVRSERECVYGEKWYV